MRTSKQKTEAIKMTMCEIIDLDLTLNKTPFYYCQMLFGKLRGVKIKSYM